MVVGYHATCCAPPTLHHSRRSMPLHPGEHLLECTEIYFLADFLCDVKELRHSRRREARSSMDRSSSPVVLTPNVTMK